MSDDFMEDLAAEAEDLRHVPTEAETARLREMCMELVLADREKAELESKLSDVKQQINKLSHKDLPDLMNSLDIDHQGLASANVDIVLSDYAKASIPKDWGDNRRTAAFAHLEELGGGDLIRSTMTLSAGKGELDTMRLLSGLVQALIDAPATDDQHERISAITDYLCEHGQRMDFSGGVSSNVELSVPWNSLTSFVKEQASKGAEMKLDLIGATVGQVVKIKPRKD